MTEPRVIPRDEHTLSRRDVDPDALKVLYRLRQANHIAYLVGGSVRDLLLGRRPKDFDIGTSAHPYEVKKLFRNCWIIGRRFRLAHVKFGPKVIEVATFRRQIHPGEEIAQDGVPAPIQHESPHRETPETSAESTASEHQAEGTERLDAESSHLIHRDNTFGTAEEDAFRRDFTINALFYDISTFSIIDYTGGLEDLRAGVVRCIGDPEVRFREDPVRMLRAVAMAARLDFTIDAPIFDAIRVLRHEIARSSPARLLEEYYKILRTGSAEKVFRGLATAGLLEPVSRELHGGAGDALWQSLARLDAYRARFESSPSSLTNAVLLGTLLTPLGLAPQGGRPPVKTSEDGRRLRPPILKLGELPLARRDVEHLRHILSLQRRLRDIHGGGRGQHAMTQRAIFPEALAWLEIHGEAPEIVGHWTTLLATSAEAQASDTAGTHDAADAANIANREVDRPRRRRRRRRRYRGEAGRS